MKETRRLPQRATWARVVYIVLAWAFAVCVAVQVFLAGMGVFMSPLYFQSHASFVHAFEWIPVLMLVAALVGGLSPKLRWMAAGLIALIAVQYVTAGMTDRGARWALWVASLHPVTATGLFWAAVVALKRARNEISSQSVARPAGPLTSHHMK